MRTTATATKICTTDAHIVLDKSKPAKIILEIDGDTLAFREKGKKTRYRIAIAEAFREAIIRTAPKA